MACSNFLFSALYSGLSDKCLTTKAFGSGDGAGSPKIGCEVGMEVTAVLVGRGCDDASVVGGEGFFRGFLAIAAVDESFCGRDLQFSHRKSEPSSMFYQKFNPKTILTMIMIVTLVELMFRIFQS